MSSINPKLSLFRDCLNYYLVDWSTGFLYNLKGELIEGVQLKFKNKHRKQQMCCSGGCDEGTQIYNLSYIFK